MSANILRFVQSAKRTADAADALSAQFARELTRILRAAERNLRAVIAKSASGERTAIVTAAQAERVRRDIRQTLKQAGYDALATEATQLPFDRIGERMLTMRRLGQQAAELSFFELSRMEALKSMYAGTLLEQGDDVAKALWQAVVRGVFGARSPERILDDLADVLDGSEPAIRTLYDTLLSIYGRQVEAIQAGDEPQAAFAYMGPVDDKTRDFCLDHVGRVYTRDEIDTLDNGQLDNVFLTGGGYNCRHVFMEVSRFSELREFVGKPVRIPEIMDDVRHVRARKKAA